MMGMLSQSADAANSKSNDVESAVPFFLEMTCSSKVLIGRTGHWIRCKQLMRLTEFAAAASYSLAQQFDTRVDAGIQVLLPKENYS